MSKAFVALPTLVAYSADCLGLRTMTGDSGREGRCLPEDAPIRGQTDFGMPLSGRTLPTE